MPVEQTQITPDFDLPPGGVSDRQEDLAHVDLRTELVVVVADRSAILNLRVEAEEHANVQIPLMSFGREVDVGRQESRADVPGRPGGVAHRRSRNGGGRDRSPLFDVESVDISGQGQVPIVSHLHHQLRLGGRRKDRPDDGGQRHDGSNTFHSQYSSVCETDTGMIVNTYVLVYNLCPICVQCSPPHPRHGGPRRRRIRSMRRQGIVSASRARRRMTAASK